MVEFTMPSLGADMEAGKLCEWMVKPGDKVKRGDIIAMVDTQKGLIDIEVFDEGIVEKILIKEGEKVPVGTVMALINDGKAAIPAVEPTQPIVNKITEEKIIEKFIPDQTVHIKASPLAKRIAAENGIDLQTVTGTGEAGAITKEDVEKAISQKSPVSEEVIQVTEKVRIAVAAAMSKSNREIPHYYLATKVDMSNALNWLNEANKQRTVKQRLLPVVLMIKSLAKALVEVPDLNAYWENGLQKKTDINIGFAVSLRTGGVMVPAIHNTEKMTLDELMTTLNDMIPRARAMKLRSSELSDSTVTMTSLGEGSTELVFGVIYPPQVALIGFGSITQQPWAEKEMLGVRPVLNVTLAADHRATDGATGGRLLTLINQYLQKPELL